VAQLLQNQIPLLISLLLNLLYDVSYLGPPADAAEICAAIPIDVALLGFEFGPIVKLSTSGTTTSVCYSFG
jgi:hypothetical protein